MKMPEAASNPPIKAAQSADSGLFMKNWNPLMLAADLPQGVIVGKAFLGTKVIIYRDPAGKVVVQSAYCPHVGADLSVGEIVDGQVRCAYHHWKFAADGHCSQIPTGEQIPKTAKIYNYPAGEAWGLIWAFNGEEALFDLPKLPNVEEDEIFFEAHHHGVRNFDGWISSSNLVDFQHLATVHGIQDAVPKSVVFDDYIIRVEQESETRASDTHLFGGTWLCAHTRYSDGTERFFMAGSSQVAAGVSDAYYVVAVRKSAAEGMGMDVARQKIAAQIVYVKKLYAEDEPILHTIRFRPRGKGTLLGSDRHFGAYLRYIQDYPRGPAFDV
jgi:phenylpropionate dioxygenase-like ring-hydroxylating dioxygenase large terminal subunit